RTTTAKGMNHAFARLTGLAPNTAYYFVVRDSDGVSDRMWFRTAPSSPAEFTFDPGGDSRHNRVACRNGNSRVSKLRPLFVRFGGDYTSETAVAERSQGLADWQSSRAPDGRSYPTSAMRGIPADSLSVVDLSDIPGANVYNAPSFGGPSSLRICTLNSEIPPAG